MIDIVIAIAYLMVVFAVGIVVACKVKNNQDYTTGGGNYGTFVIMATVSASFIGGGFTLGLASKTFSYGIVFILVIWGFSLKELLVAKYIAPRMATFKGKAETVGDIMEIAYGTLAKIFTGFASVMVCGGIIGAQVAGCGNIMFIFLDIDPKIGGLFTALVVLAYATLGGLKSVVAADIVHFVLLIIMLPMVCLFGINYVGSVDVLMNSLPASYTEPFGSIDAFVVLILFLSFFFGETLIPPYVQRLLIGKSPSSTVRGTMYSGLLSIIFFALIGVIGLIAFHLDVHLKPNLALPYVINTVMPIGLRGFAVAAMLAVVMSSADSFLNATSIAAKKDILMPLGLLVKKDSKKDLLASRIITLVIGCVAIVFSLVFTNMLDMLLYSYQFWTPFILVPLVAAIYGVRANSAIFMQSALAGILCLMWWEIYHPYTTGVDGALEGVIAGIATNSLVFFSLLYLRKKKLLVLPKIKRA